MRLSKFREQLDVKIHHRESSPRFSLLLLTIHGFLSAFVMKNNNNIMKTIIYLFLGCIGGSPLPNIMQAKSIEEILKDSKESNKRSRDDVFKGRRLLENRKLEVSTHILADQFDGQPGFHHSVASGDPLSDAVIIWTRYTPENVDDVITLEFRMAAVDDINDSMGDYLDPAKNSLLKQGKVTVNSESDFIAKIDVTGLKSNTNYVYVFRTQDKTSDIGLTKTAPAPGEENTLTYAFFSCSHFSNGFFHPYDIASTIENIDLAIFLGDYYYEYGNYDTYAREASALRDDKVLPIWETLDLQDYRNRHATYVGHDEGLRNLRRRVPILAWWDDHETTNDSFGTEETTGAENHQPVCPVNETSPDAEKNGAGCDRDEGDAVSRFEAAAQAYMEWLPLRYVEGSMGQTNIGSLTKVIEWGNLATFVGVDTRISHRSEAGTGSSAFGNTGYLGVAISELNVSSYFDPASPVYQTLQAVAASDLEARNSEERSIIGKDIDILTDAFESSKAAGKPWQIWCGNTMMGHYVLPDTTKIHEAASDAQSQAIVKNLFDALLALPQEGISARIFAALAAFDMEWNEDDYSGFHHERMQIIEMAKNSTNNLIVLGGDLHDGFAWQIPSSGLVDGDPVFVNLGCASVTAPGFAALFAPVFAPVADLIGGEAAVVAILEQAYLNQNPNLKLVNLEYKGLTVVTVDTNSHIAEYFGVSNEDRLTDYPDARGDKLTVTPICKGSVTTDAETPGSLESGNECTKTRFVSMRPPVYDLTVPSSSNDDLDTLTDCGYQGCTFVSEQTESAASPLNTLAFLIIALAFMADALV